MTSDRLSLAVADVSWFTTENLFRELDEPDVSLLALRCLDYRNGWRKGLRPWSPSCRTHRQAERRWARDMLLPPGWMKRFPRIGMRPIARTIERFWTRRGGRRGLVVTYPHYRHLVDLARPDATLYYNLDDYTLYWPDHADELRALERDLVSRSASTVCVALEQAEALRREVPAAASRIHHIAHGTPAMFLTREPLDRPGPPPDDVARLPRPLLGYVGSLEDRLDWPLLETIAMAFPTASIVVVGRPPGPGAEAWRKACARTIALPNVHVLGWRRQHELPAYYQTFDVNLIPYLVDHPFNRACSPTKIMDGMGATRPLVSTAVPECRLYTDLFDVAETHDAFVEAVRRIVEQGSDDGRAGLRHAHAAANLCSAVASRVVATLEASA
ncbi:glycosyltransferase [Planctomyces sp. SH-PL62]|uniref:glycosyltransferase n=1 Tax=Planctomyces sp. SH-PL62 TaxID=1636152 RepID=UPI00078DCA83|nr:glycosyltransferase [Planctomyces sp. SH-PL62]AMV39511.1 Putative teichuronic acid biosynthesis glycosyltransferase TuaH [Planctomyces sp. SH-PL62]